ncbi:MAG TPA: hypothetical protein PLI99_03600 [archaeon]|nr:hypothetical protein [archaeon]
MSKKLVFFKFKSILRESILLLLKNPFLFVPKLLIAFFYGVGTLVAVGLVKELFSFSSFSTEQMLSFDFTSFFSIAILLMLFTLFSFFFDLFFNGLYPILVRLALKKKLSFLDGVNLFKPKIFSVFLTGVFLWVLITLVSILESFLVIYYNLSKEGFVLSFLITFLFAFLFYFLYPKIVFENKEIQESFCSSVFDSFKNKKIVFLLSSIPFIVSVLKLILAYFSNDLVFLIIFWVIVILTGVIYSIHSVVNQIAYEKILAKN